MHSTSHFYADSYPLHKSIVSLVSFNQLDGEVMKQGMANYEKYECQILIAFGDRII
jgi:hypothetical protein